MIKIEQEELIVALFKEGLNPVQIGKRTKIGRDSIRRIGTKHGLWKTCKQRRQERREVFVKMMEDFKIMSYDQLVFVHGQNNVTFIGQYFGFPFKKKDVERRRKRIAQLTKQNHSSRDVGKLLNLPLVRVSHDKGFMKMARPRLDGKAKLKRDQRLLRDYAKGMSTEKLKKKYKLVNIGMVLINYPEEVTRIRALR